MLPFFYSITIVLGGNTGPDPSKTVCQSVYEMGRYLFMKYPVLTGMKNISLKILSCVVLFVVNYGIYSWPLTASISYMGNILFDTVILSTFSIWTIYLSQNDNFFFFFQGVVIIIILRFLIRILRIWTKATSSPYGTRLQFYN